MKESVSLECSDSANKEKESHKYQSIVNVIALLLVLMLSKKAIKLCPPFLVGAIEILFAFFAVIVSFFVANWSSIFLALAFFIGYWKIDDFMQEMRDDIKILKKRTAKKCCC